MMLLLLKRLLVHIFCYCLGIFYGSMILCRLLWNICREGPGILKATPKTQAPACLEDEGLGVHNYITTKSGFKFHYVAKGDLGNPLMLCLHGFPEFWYSWRFQLKEFSSSFRVVAVDLRGYGFSDKPRAKSMYTLQCLSQDVKDIVGALGYSSCVLMGHDWGGFISWSVAHRFPEIVDQLIILNCPHPKAFSEFILSSWKQFLMSWYIFFYQIPYLPETLISQKNFKIIKAIFKGSFARLQAKTLIDNNQSWKEETKFKGVKNKVNMTDEDIEAYKFAMSQPGAVTCALNYFRNIPRFTVDKEWMKDGQNRITSPTLVVWGDQDRFLRKESLNSLYKIVDNLKIRFVGGASHWVQQDEPQIVNDFIKEFLGK